MYISRADAGRLISSRCRRVLTAENYNARRLGGDADFELGSSD